MTNMTYCMVLDQRKLMSGRVHLVLAQEMDFQRLLLEVGMALCKDEVKALAFLCTDLLGQSLTSVELASDLFSRLADHDHLSPEQPHLLPELLLTIHRNRLVRDLNLTDPEFTTRTFISPYRWTAHILLLLTKLSSMILFIGNSWKTLVHFDSETCFYLIDKYTSLIGISSWY